MEEDSKVPPPLPACPSNKDEFDTSSCTTARSIPDTAQSSTSLCSTAASIPDTAGRFNTTQTSSPFSSVPHHGNVLGLDTVKADPNDEDANSKLVAAITRGRLCDANPTWADLVARIGGNWSADAVRHVMDVLTSIQQDPSMIECDVQTGLSFLYSCAREGNEIIKCSAIQTLVIIHTNGSESVRTELDDCETRDTLATIIRFDYEMKQGKASWTPATNERCALFINSCLDSGNSDTMAWALRTFKCSRELYKERLPAVRLLIEICLTSEDLSIQSIALLIYSKIVTDYTLKAVPAMAAMDNVFPLILSAARAQANDSIDWSSESFTPLHCIENILAHAWTAERLTRHLAHILILCKIIDYSSHDTSSSTWTKQLLGVAILDKCASKYLIEIVGIFGNDGLAKLGAWLLEAALACDASGDASRFRMLTGDIVMFAKLGRISRAGMAPFLQRCADAACSDRLKQAGLRIIAFAPEAVANISEAASFIQSTLADSNTLVRAYARKAFNDVVNGKTAGDWASHLWTHLLTILQSCEDDALSNNERAEYLDCLIHFVTRFPNLLGPHISAILSLSCQMSMAHKGEKHGDTAWTLISRICEKCAAMIKTKAADQIKPILESALARTQKTALIDVIVNSLGDKHTMPILIYIALENARHSDWKKRLLSVRASGAVCSRCDKATITKHVCSLVSSLSDTHPQVREAACDELHRLAALRPLGLRECHGMVVPALATVLNNVRDAPLAAAAGSALAEFMTDWPKHICANFKPALLSIVNTLQTSHLTLMPTTRTMLLKKTLAPICSMVIADSLMIYSAYDLVMPALKAVFKERPPDANNMGLVLHNIALIGGAATRRKFCADGIEILRIVSEEIGLLLSMSKDLDLPVDFEKIISLAGIESAQFLPSLVPSLIAAYKDFNKLFNSVNIMKKIDLYVRRVRVMQMLKFLAIDTGVAFKPYVHQVAAMAIFDLVQIDCTWGAEIFPTLLAALKREAPSIRQQLWARYWSKLDREMKNKNKKCTLLLINSVMKSIAVMGRERVTEQEMMQINTMLTREITKRRVILAMLKNSKRGRLAKKEKELIMEISEIESAGSKILGRQFVSPMTPRMPHLESTAAAKSSIKNIESNRQRTVTDD